MTKVMAKLLQLLLLPFVVNLVLGWKNAIRDEFRVSCKDIKRDFITGHNIFDNEDIIGEYLETNGYTSRLDAPFSQLFEGAPLPRNITRDFYRTNQDLRGVQIIVDKFTRWYTQVPKSEYVKMTDFLDAASHCVSQCKRAPKKSFSCNSNYKYRTLDGTCNNLKDPIIGSILTPFSRLLPAEYDDNVLEMRKSVMGGELASSRYVVDNLFAQPRKPRCSQEMVPNMGFFFFGQIIVHDTASQVNMNHRLPTNDPIRCCSADFKRVLPKSLLHHACLPFSIAKDDTFYGAQNLGCHNYIRSQPIFPNDCKLSAAQQANRVTGYMDLSPIYGLTKKQSYSLRTFIKGMLKTDRKNILPIERNCNRNNCYYAGDFRVNQTPGLTVMHALLFRLHNQIAKTLSSINPQWNDEKLFQEGRRITIGLWQHLVYDEYIPLLLGDDKPICFDAECDYNETVIGTTMNDFTTGVFRYLHSYLPTYLQTYDKDGNQNGALRFSSVIENTRILNDNFDDVMRGLIYQNINLASPHNDEVRNRLFNNSDLISVDIQRGRDHGMPPYWRYREFCGLPLVNTFEDLYPLISLQNIEYLKLVYKSVHDIDLLVGGGMEDKQGALMGPTFQCVSKIQFAHFKAGDRFFYSHKKTVNPFTEAQLKEIQQFTFAKLLCLTAKVESVPRLGFFTPNEKNIMVSCKKLRTIDLLPWLDY